MLTYSRQELVGLVGAKPEVQHSEGGTAYCHFNVAVDRYAGKDSEGKVLRTTQWHRCTAFGKNAERVGLELDKGTPVFVVGEYISEKGKDDKEYWKILVSTFIRLEKGGMQAREQSTASGASTSAGSSASTAAATETDNDVPF